MGKAIGIDLGTTNTIISYYDKKGKIKQFKDKGEIVIPSAIYLVDKSTILIGENALRRGEINPEHLITNFKYDIGDRKAKEYIAESGERIRLNALQVAERVIVEVLKKVTTKIMKEFPGEDIEEAVITVPAKFNPIQKENTKKAALNAGLQEVKLALESTAAAIAYIDEEGIERVKSKVMVYDFGGGTFDVSIIEKTGTGFREVTTPEGDRNLGGNLITKRIADYIFDEVENEIGLEMPKDREDFDSDDYDFDFPMEIYIKNYNAIYSLAERIKKEFSDAEEVEEILSLTIPKLDEDSEERRVDIELNFTYEQFCELIEEDIDRTIEIVDKVLRDSDIDKDELTVILTGGSSLLKLVGVKLEEYFDKEIEVFRTATLISEGACILTESMSGLEVEGNLPNDIGIKINGTLGNVLFKPLLNAGTSEKNAVVTEKFSLLYDNQRTLKITLYERDIKNYPNAEKIRDDGCIMIDEFEIDLPEHLSKSDTVVELTLGILKDGTLSLDTVLTNSKGVVYDEKLTVKREEILE